MKFNIKDKFMKMNNTLRRGLTNALNMKINNTETKNII